MELKLIINTISLLFFASIFYISIETEASIKKDANKPIMAVCWLMWIYAIPMAIIIVNIFNILNIIFDYFF
jgi:ABC-type Na+ efflux pump permease subunit